VKALRTRSASEGLGVHACIAPRIYEADDVQKDRIRRSREMLEKCICDYNCEHVCDDKTIVELGCGCCDISGPFANDDNMVVGFDCNPESLALALKRFPNIIRLAPIPDDPQCCDVLVCCEFLEHIENPSELIAGWLPKAERCVISHPLDGDISGDLSAGEHQWSFSKDDFENWFRIGGHELIESEVFKMGGYQIVLGRGENLGNVIP
jgi:hypothetical protein